MHRFPFAGLPGAQALQRPASSSSGSPELPLPIPLPDPRTSRLQKAWQAPGPALPGSPAGGGAADTPLPQRPFSNSPQLAEQVSHPAAPDADLTSS